MAEDTGALGRGSEGTGAALPPAASPRSAVSRLPPRALSAWLKAALIAALVAALITGVFHFALSEPVVDAAIALEGSAAQDESTDASAHHEESVEVVSRDGQKAGLFLAWLLYGAIWASLLAAASHLLRVQTAGQGAALALMFGVAVALYPGLKYPANPPGVGDPETILFRQATYSAALAIGLLGAAGAWLAARRAGPAFGGAIFAAVLLLGFVALPPHPESTGAGRELIASFRVLSLAGYGVFWAVYAAAFAWLLRDRGQRTGRRPAGTSSSAPMLGSA